LYCQNCGAINDDNSRFWAECGNPINNVSAPYNNYNNANYSNNNQANVNNQQVSKPANAKKNKTGLIILIVVIAVFGFLAATVVGLVILFHFVLGGDLSVSDVKNSKLYGYSSEVTIGEAFDDYFDDGSWDSYTIDDGTVSVVDYTAEVETYDDEEIEFTISFVHDEDDEDGEFSLQSIRIENYETGEYNEYYGLDMDSIMYSIYNGTDIDWYW